MAVSYGPLLTTLLLIYFSTLSTCSFMAIGPPGAPYAAYMNSTAALTSEILALHLDSNPGLTHLNSSSPSPPRFANVTANFRLTSSTEGFAQAPMAYWMADPKYAHKQPLAGSADYPVLRNVKAYGAKGDGVTDDWAAIMSAVTRGGRCGEGCNATSTKGAVVYFPPGKYLITKPIIQYYFTVFAGDPSDRAVILGAKDFKGIALVDTDVYIPESNGQNWWINQNNFYRQIRNLVLDLTLMPNYVEGGVGNGFPAGIHWQVSQACTLHNLDFKMPTTAGATHRGVFMENGSGGFVSDLSFTGGAVGFVAGSQQYTARNLRFSKCQTAIEMLWSWGFTWKSMLVSDCKVGINATGFGVDGNTQKKQSTGSLIVQGSSFTNVDTMLIVLQTTGYQATVLLENIELAGSSRVAVASNTGDALLAGGPQKIPLWGLGRRFDDASPEGRITMGPIPVPKKDPGLLLLDDWYEREKPMYHREPAGNFINVLDFGVKNDGTSAAGNARGINEALAKAAGEKKVLVFPAGIYLVDETLFIPSGTRMVGVLWSQIVATGAKFADPDHPYILARVGQPGDVGAVEISDMLFTQSGPTAGAVLMEWNIYQSNQGSAAMFDVIFRVGGAAGSGLLESNCHQFGAQKQESCMAAAMMLHVRSGSSIYMENMWFWVADHDVESKLQTRINIYGARGVLIESQGPSWVYSVSNEHSTLYNWQLAGANNIYLGHIQSETPYFQAGQTPSLRPYPPSEHFAYDPEFADCGAAKGFDTCREAWALRVIKSRNVYLYGGGFYAFFTDYKDDCAKFGGVCQDRLIDTDYSEGVWMFNLFTVGGKEVISPQGLKTVERKTEENGFATATNAWLLLSNKGATIGGTRKGALERQDEEPGPLMCNFNLEFPTFDALDKASSTMDPYCVYIAGIATSGTMIETALSEYNKTKPGYDDLFNAYSKVFRSYMAREIKDFMGWWEGDGPGLKYFDCQSTRSNSVAEKGPCGDKDYLTKYKPGLSAKFSMRFTLRDANGFWKELAEKTGIDKSWVNFNGKDSGFNGGIDRTPISTWEYLGIPQMNSDYPVPNPKEIIELALPNAQDLLLRVTESELDMVTSGQEGTLSDPFKVYSVPAMLLSQAIEQIGTVRDIGKKEKKREQQALILTILGAIFAVVPFIGELGALSAGLANMARVFAVMGVGADIGLGVADAVINPESAPLAVMGILMNGFAGGAIGRGTREEMQGMAKIRNQIDGKVASGMGKGFQHNNDIVVKLSDICRKR